MQIQTFRTKLKIKEKCTTQENQGHAIFNRSKKMFLKNHIFGYCNQ